MEEVKTPDLEQKIRTRYLNRLDEQGWDAEGPRLDFGVAALPFFIAAFEKEQRPIFRALLTQTIWQFRDRAALPTLAIALRDSCSDVWKEALDGLVAPGGEEALIILTKARQGLTETPEDVEKLEWIEEAVTQVVEKL